MQGNSRSSIRSGLVIDDDRIFLTAMGSLLEERGLEVIRFARDGAEALDVLDECGDELDFIVCDLELPHLDGIQFLRHLGERKYNGPVMVVSGKDRAIIPVVADLAKMHDLNIVAALPKPLREDELNRTLSALNAPWNRGSESIAKKLPVSLLQQALIETPVNALYEPIAAAATNDICALDVIPCWDHPHYGGIGAQQLSALAGTQDLAEQFAAMLLEKILWDATEWREIGVDVQISLPLDPVALGSLGFPDRIARLVDRSKLDRSLFMWAVRDGEMLELSTSIKENLARMRMMGFELTLDGYGEPDSNLCNLAKLPFNELRIACAHLRPLSRVRVDRVKIEASLSVARKMGLRVVAKGVASREDWSLSVSRCVDRVQGPFVSEALTARGVQKLFCS